MEKASKNLIPVTLELGGNDPTIVLKDADIEKAVSDIVNGAYLFSGQVCMGVKRVIVERDIIDEFTENLVKQTGKLKVGNPMNKDTDIGQVFLRNRYQKANRVPPYEAQAKFHKKHRFYFWNQFRP